MTAISPRSAAAATAGPPDAILFSDKHFQTTKRRRGNQSGDPTVANNRSTGQASPEDRAAL